MCIYIYFVFIFYAPVAQPGEHVLGKDEATGSIPVGGFNLQLQRRFDMREIIHFQCTVCSRLNYNSTKDKKKKPERIELNKYCRFCRKRTPHKETKK